MERRVFPTEKMVDLFNIFNNEEISYSEFKSIISSSYTIYDLFETNNRDKNISLSLPLLALYCKSKNAIKFCIESTPDVFTQFAQSSINGEFFSLSDTFHYEASVNFINQVMENFGSKCKDNLISIYHHEPLFVIDMFYHYLDTGRYKKPSFDFKELSREHTFSSLQFIIDNKKKFIKNNESVLPKDIFYLYCQTCYDKDNITSDSLLSACGISKDDIHTDPNIIFSLFSNNHEKYMIEHLKKMNIPFDENPNEFIDSEEHSRNVSEFLQNKNVQLIPFLQYFYSTIFDNKRKKDFILRNGDDRFYQYSIQQYLVAEKEFNGFYKEYYDITHHPFDICNILNRHPKDNIYNYAKDLEEMLKSNNQIITQNSDICQCLSVIIESKDKALFKRIFENRYLGLHHDRKEIINNFIEHLCKKIKNDPNIPDFIDIALEFKSNVLGFKEPIRLPDVNKTTPGYRYLEKLKIMEDISQKEIPEDFQNKKRL